MKSTTFYTNNFISLFNKIKQAGEIEEEEMRRVFNCGIGYVLVVPPEIDYGVQIGEISE